MDEMHSQLHDFINTQIKVGFKPREAIIEAAVDTLRNDCGGFLVRQEAAKIVDKLLMEHV
ncbi:MAG: hypothetical protein Q9P01_21870 [Anaerolineae bacterium]|nr:hypothetical protein [Anaerolineae bacterium]MDQ7037389.1 hypothetical protein [Anaerolineae bacterium]